MIEKIILKPRQTGRTTELIKMAAEHNLYIVTTDRNRALFIDKMAKDLGLKIPFPITVRELPIHPVMRHGCSFVNEVLVDDADQVLECLVGTKIKALAMEKSENVNVYNCTDWVP